MPSTSPPTFSQSTQRWAAEVNRFQKVRLLANVNASPQGNLVDLDRTAQQTTTVDGADAAGLEAGRSALRSAFNTILSSAATWLIYCMHQIATSASIKSSADSILGMLSDIYLYMAKNSQRIASRLFLRGQFVAGSPCLGTGVWRRCWVDSYGFPLEASHAQVWTAKVIRDQNNGTLAGKEVWDLAPQPFLDYVEWGVSGRGSGKHVGCVTLSSDDTILNNASFSDRSGTDAVPTAITNWTSDVAVIGDGTDYQVDRTNYFYAGTKEGGSAGSLRVYLTRTLSQALSVANVGLVNAPYYAGVMARGDWGSWIGTVQLSWGSQSATATVLGVAPTPVVGAAGGVTAGTHTYVWTAVVNGVESAYSPASSIVTAAGGGSTISITTPAGPSGTTSRKIYRTIAGNTGSYLLVGTINDNNAATALSDTVADGSLGAAVSTGAQTSWVRVENPSFSTSSAGWQRNWQQQGGNTIKITVTKTSGAGTWVNLDAVQLFPLYNVDGVWEAPIAGALAWVNEDTGTITDTEQGAAPATGAAAGILQDWNHRSGMGSFPSAPYSPVAANCTSSVAAPVIAQSATAGVVTAGAHLVGMTWLDQNGNESGISVLSNSVTADGAHAIDVTTIPTHLGTTGVIASRKLYMNKAGTGSGGTFYYTGITISDNTTTSLTGANGINLSDATLGANAVAPAGVTIAEPI